MGVSHSPALIYNISLLCSKLQLAKEYGNIYSLWGGGYHCIVLCGYQAVKEVLIHHSEAFVDRLVTPYISAQTKEKGKS